MGELSSEIILNPDEDPRFSIEGPGGSILVIDLFAPELNGSLVYCRDPILEQLGGLFPLQSTRKWQVTMQSLKRKNVIASLSPFIILSKTLSSYILC